MDFVIFRNHQITPSSKSSCQILCRFCWKSKDFMWYYFFLIIFTWIIITFTLCAHFEAYGHEVTSDCIFSKILTFDSIIQFAWVSHNTCDVISCQYTWKGISLLNVMSIGLLFPQIRKQGIFHSSLTRK